MLPRARSISAARPAVHGTESGRHASLRGWAVETAGHCLYPDDFSRDDNGLRTRSPPVIYASKAFQSIVVFPQSFGLLCLVSMGHSEGEIKTLSSHGRAVSTGKNIRLGFLAKRQQILHRTLDMAYS